MEKPFVVFRFADYYPGGGWNDYFERYATVEEARAGIRADKMNVRVVPVAGWDNYDIHDVRDGSYHKNEEDVVG